MFLPSRESDKIVLSQVFRLLKFQGTATALNWLRWKDEGLRERIASHGDLPRKLCALKKRISHDSLLPIMQPTEKRKHNTKICFMSA